MSKKRNEVETGQTSSQQSQATEPNSAPQATATVTAMPEPQPETQSIPEQPAAAAEPTPIDLLSVDEAQVEALKAASKAAPVLNEVLSARNKPDSQLRCYTIFLDARMANFLLKFNLKTPKVTNRPVNWGTVDSMARQIINGHFRNTGEPLLFTDTAEGIDLQHRCYAVLKAAETNPEAGYETTVVTGVHVDSLDDLINNLLVMGVAKRTNKDLSHFAGVGSLLWKMVEYYLLPEDIKPGQITRSLSKYEINDAYISRRALYDETFDVIRKLYLGHKDVNTELGEKRLPLYAAAALKMYDVNPERTNTYMEAFFNPLENTLPKGNPVDAVRQELVTAYGTGQRDLTRPIFIRRAMLEAFKEFVAGTIKSKWQSFLTAPEKRSSRQPRQPKQQQAAA